MYGYTVVTTVLWVPNRVAISLIHDPAYTTTMHVEMASNVQNFESAVSIATLGQRLWWET